MSKTNKPSPKPKLKRIIIKTKTMQLLSPNEASKFMQNAGILKKSKK